MAKDINGFIKELAEYINTFIVGTENTYIKECVVSDMVTNRGHAIPIKVKFPDDFREKFQNVGPCYYAEELMEEFHNSTIAAIGENINVRVTKDYPGILKMMAVQVKSEEKTICDYDKKDIIVTALPTSHVSRMNSDELITKEFPELGLTTIMKGCIGSDPNSKGRAYFAPIIRKDGRVITDEDWDNAAMNSLCYSDINLVCPMLEGTDIDTPVCGQIADSNNFYDYFYLLSAEQIWGGITETLDAEKIYIIPQSAHSAQIVMDSQAIRENQTACAFCKAVMKAAVKSACGPVFILDCSTLQITKLKKG